MLQVKLIIEIEEEFVNLVPEGYAGDLWEEFKFTKRRRMLIRKPALKAIELLRKLKDGSLENPYESSIIFDGVAGSGKSACLNHVVHYARKAGILTLFIPNSKDWMMVLNILYFIHIIYSRFILNLFSIIICTILKTY